MQITEPSVQPKKKPGRKPKGYGKPKQQGNETTVKVTGGTFHVYKDEVTRVPFNETPEQRRLRLLAELAELNQVAPPSPDNLGPNYWTMPHGTLKTLCISKGIVDRTGTREGMIAAIQTEDMKLGLQPHPRENEQRETGLRTNNTPVYAEPQNRDSTRIVDSEGNCYAMVYRVARMLDGKPILANMDGNARKIVAALNEGRVV